MLISLTFFTQLNTPADSQFKHQQRVGQCQLQKSANVMQPSKCWQLPSVIERFDTKSASSLTIYTYYTHNDLKQSIKSASYFIEKMQNILQGQKNIDIIKSYDEFFIAIQGWTKHQDNLNSESQTDKGSTVTKCISNVFNNSIAFSLKNKQQKFLIIFNQNNLSDASSDEGQSIESAATYYSVPATQFQIMPLYLFSQNQNPSKPYDHDQYESITNETITEKEEIKQIDQEIKNDPKNSSLYLQKSKNLLIQQKYQILHYQNTVILKSNRLNEAVDVLIQAFSIGYGDFETWQETGFYSTRIRIQTLMKQNCIPEALQCFDQAYLLDPNSFELYQIYSQAIFQYQEKPYLLNQFYNYYYILTMIIELLNIATMLWKGIMQMPQHWLKKGNFYLRIVDLISICDLKCFKESIKCFNQSINLGMKPEFVENSFNEALQNVFY